MTRFDRVRFHVIARILLPATAAVVLGMGSLAAQTPDDRALWTPDAAAPLETDWSDEVPAHLAVVDGEAWIDRDGETEPADENTPLITGDRLRTGRGRLEILFADGGSLALDEQTSVTLLSNTLTRLDGGRLKLTLVRGSEVANYRIDAAGVTTWIRAAGEYRLSADTRRAEADVELLVVRGYAELTSAYGRTLVRAGYEARASARTTPTAPYAVTVSSWDSFDRWVENQRADRQTTAATSYLPAELRYYDGLLDRNGAWQYDQAYGYVWYPRVDNDWRPYSYGRWSAIGAYGWTWIGHDRWSWPTHHYGRWGLAGARWYWIPDRRWAPAWVSWASAPGYVSWCPLGYDNRPLLSINIGINSGRAWSYAPSRTFHSGVVVASRNLVRPANLAGGFVVRPSAPARPGGIRSDRQPLRGPNRADRPAPRVERGDSPAFRDSTPERPSRSVSPSLEPSRFPRRAPADDASRSVVMPSAPRGGRTDAPEADDTNRRIASPRTRTVAPAPPSGERSDDRPSRTVRQPQSRVEREAPRESSPPPRAAEVDRSPSRERREPAPERTTRSAPERSPQRQSPPQSSGSSGGSAQGRAVPRGR